MNERIHFFIKKYIYLTLYFRKGDGCCVRDKLETGTDCYIDLLSSSSAIAAILSHLGWVAQPWVTEDRKAFSLQAGSHAGILSPTDSNRLFHGYIIV